ncbi:hypothetical protein Tco_0059531 [Tanacetum coccineum]
MWRQWGDGGSGWWIWARGARGSANRVDRTMGMVFKNSPKNSLEKFSGGDATVVAEGEIFDSVSRTVCSTARESFVAVKALEVYATKAKRVEENLHINFLEDQPNVTGTGPNWMFVLDFLTNSMNYIPVSVENQVNVDAEVVAKALDDATRQAFEEEKRNIASQKRAAQATSTNKLSTVRSYVSTATTPYVSAASTPTGANAGESSFVYLGGQIPIDASTLPNADLPTDPNMPDLEDVSNAFPNDGIFSGAYDDDDVGAEADFNNMDNTIDVSPIPTLRVHKDYPKGQILGDPKSAVQTRGKIQKASSVQQALVSYIYNQNRTNHKDHQNCLFACFLSQEEPKNISQALQDESWVEAMQEELLQFKLQKVWVLVDLPYGKKKRVVNETPREEDTAKVPAKQEVTEQGTKKRKSGHVKMIARKRPRPQPDDDSDDEHRKCLRIVTFDSTLDSQIMETKSFVSKLHKVSSPDGDYLVVYRVNGHFRAFNYLMEVLHIFDRQDLFHLYDLVMKQYSEITPEGIELILWGDLKIMMESSTEENDQGDF